MLVASLCVVPWAIGGTYPFTRTLLLAAAAIMAAVSLFITPVPRNNIRWDAEPRPRFPKIIWMLLLGSGVTVFQLSSIGWIIEAPVDNNAAVVVGESTSSADKHFTLFANATAPQIDSSPTITAYPPATRQRLIELLIAVSFFVLASQMFIDERSITNVFFMLTILGGALSVFGIVQGLTFNGSIYGVYELLFGGDPFGPFVNRNNAAGFLLIPLATGFFFTSQKLITWGTKWQLANKGEPFLLSSHDWIQAPEPQRSSSSWLLELLTVLKPLHLYFLTTLGVLVVGIILTMSRGGIIALLVQLVLFFILVARTHLKLTLAVALSIMLFGLSMVCYLDQSTALAGEIKSLADLSSSAAVRLSHWKDAISFGLKNSILGAGNGTYRYISPTFQTFYYPRSFFHAESVFIETFVELGFVGLALIVGCVLMMLHYSIALLRQDDVLDKSLGITGITCLSGQFTMAFLDFGLYQAPNSISVATVLGVVAGRACHVTGLTSNVSSDFAKKNRHDFLRQAVTVLLLVSMLGLLRESYGIESGRLATRKIARFNRLKKRAGGPLKVELETAAIKSLLEKAAAIRPDDSEVYSQMGELKIAQARILRTQANNEILQLQIRELEHAVATLENREAGIDKIRTANSKLGQLKAVQPQAIWALSAPIGFHQQLRRAQRKSDDSSDGIFNDDRIVTLLSDAYQNYLKAANKCPFLPTPHLKMAQLACFAGANLEQEHRHIAMALKRSVTDTQLLYNCGFLALNSGDQKLAVSLWAKCLRSTHLNVHERGIISLCLEELPMKLFFERVLPQNPHDLIRIARSYFGQPNLMVPKHLLLEHTTKIILSDTQLNNLEESLLLAAAAYLRDDLPEAIKHYQAASELNPQTATWRLEYAEALIGNKQFDEAMRQLKICQLDSSIRQNRVMALIAKTRRSR